MGDEVGKITFGPFDPARKLQARVEELEAEVESQRNAVGQWQATSDQLYESSNKHGAWRKNAEARIAELEDEQEVDNAAATKLRKEVDRLRDQRDTAVNLSTRLDGYIEALEAEQEDANARASKAEHENVKTQERMELMAEVEVVDRLTAERDTAMLDIGFFSKQTDRVVIERDKAITEMTKYARVCGGLDSDISTLIRGIEGLNGPSATLPERLVPLFALAERLKP